VGRNSSRYWAATTNNNNEEMLATIPVANPESSGADSMAAATFASCCHILLEDNVLTGIPMLFG
jgi:hypothetical protein